MNQLNLFETETQTGFYGQPVEPKKNARTNDPETSKAAAASVNLEGNFKLFFESLSASESPLTAQEIAADAVPIDGSLSVTAAISKRETVRKRASEMVERGLVRSVGSRICTVTGNESTTYEVVR
jgi:hypothetical protein